MEEQVDSILNQKGNLQLDLLIRDDGSVDRTQEILKECELRGKLQVKDQVNLRYENIDCLRALSCFAIIAMHIKANTEYQIDGFIWNTVIPSWTWLIYLFLIISGFGMCCGYYEKVVNRTIDIDQFYLKRFQKTVPFFACLVLLTVIMEHSVSGVYEGLMEVTMAYGLLPNNELGILGVSWTLGVIFLFYMLFPYFGS